MEGKKSFLLYTDIIHTVKKLPMEKRGELFTTILEYVNDENPDVKDLIIDLVFEPIKQNLKRDLVKWNEFIDKQKVNGSKGGRPKNPEKPSKPKKPKPFSENPKNPTNVNVNVNGTVNVNEKENIIDFEIFWNEYDKKSGKQDAITQWGKLSEKEKEKAVAAISVYKAKQPDRTYRLDPERYLKKRKWEDDELQEKQKVVVAEIREENYNNFTEYLKALKSAGLTERYEQEKLRLPADYNI